MVRRTDSPNTSRRPAQETTLEGLLEHVVYTNEDTAWSVVRLSVADHDGPVTAVGNLAGARPGESLRLEGQWQTDRRYGEQFRVRSYVPVQPATQVGIEKYLASGMVPGLGPAFAARLVAHFGVETLEVIDNEPHRLTEVEGIGPVRSRRIQRAWGEQRQIKEVMIFLQSHGISPSYAVRILKQYGDRAVAVVRSNPYQLAADVHGVGFIIADRIAASLGIDKDSPQRAEAGVLHVVAQQAGDGHVFCPRMQLVAHATSVLEIDEDRVDQAVDALAEAGRVVIEPLEDDQAVYLKALHLAESGAATHLRRLLDAPPTRARVDVDSAIAHFERDEDIVLAEHQRDAISRAVSTKVLVVTGGPGTGKTTIVNGIIRVVEGQNRRVLLCAPTGRAAKRMEEATGHQAQTIHRLLAFSPKTQRFERDEANPLETDAVIVDEVSMIDTVLFHQLLKALPCACQLVLVGDSDQLPSVGPGSVLADLISSRVAHVVRLTEIFRQASQSLIVVNAHRVNSGQMPEVSQDTDGEPSDFYFIDRDDPDAILSAVTELVCNRIPRRFGLDPIQHIQVLSPMRKGLLGVGNLNTELQRLLNPHGAALSRGSRLLRVGDRVMQIRNNYDLDVFNGDIGRVMGVDDEEGRLSVSFDERIVHYEMRNIDDLMLAYACSIHKSQGSEYPAVVIPLHTQHYTMLQRNLLYTAVTRGKTLVTLVGSRRAVRIAVQSAHRSQRYSWLAERLAAAEA